MKRKQILWIILWFLSIQVSSCLFRRCQKKKPMESIVLHEEFTNEDNTTPMEEITAQEKFIHEESDPIKLITVEKKVVQEDSAKPTEVSTVQEKWTDEERNGLIESITEEQKIMYEDSTQQTQTIAVQKRFIHNYRPKLTPDQKNYVYKGLYPAVEQFCRSWPSQMNRIIRFIMEFLWDDQSIVIQTKFIHDERSKLTRDQKDHVYQALYPVVQYYCRSWSSQVSWITRFIMDYLWLDLPANRILPPPHGLAFPTPRQICKLSSDNRWFAMSIGRERNNNYPLSALSLWNVQTGKCHWNVIAHTWMIQTLDMTSDNQYVISGGWDGRINIWSLPTGELKRILMNENSICSVSLSADNQLLVSAYGHSTVRVWSIETGRCIQLYKHPDHNVCWAQFCHNDRHIISAGKSVYVWDIQTKTCLQKLRSTKYIMNTCTLSDDEKFLLSVSGNDTTTVWDMITGKCMQIFQTTVTERTGCFVKANTCVAVIDKENTLRIWRIIDGHCVQEFQNISSIEHSHSSWLRVRDTECLVVATGHTLQVLAIESGQSFFTTEDYTGTESSSVILLGQCLLPNVCLSSEGRFLIYQTNDIYMAIKISVFSENQ